MLSDSQLSWCRPVPSDTGGSTLCRAPGIVESLLHHPWAGLGCQPVAKGLSRGSGEPCGGVFFVVALSFVFPLSFLFLLLPPGGKERALLRAQPFARLCAGPRVAFPTPLSRCSQSFPPQALCLAWPSCGVLGRPQRAE